jgi:hypothetical protein
MFVSDISTVHDKRALVLAEAAAAAASEYFIFNTVFLIFFIYVSARE